MTTEEEIYAQLNFMFSFINEIESFNDFASQYVTLIFERQMIFKDKNIDFIKDFNKISTELPDDEKKLLAGLLNILRRKITIIYLKYNAVKKIYNFDEIKEDYDKLFRNEIIDTNDLINISLKLNSSYLKISKELLELRKKYSNL